MKHDMTCFLKSVAVAFKDVSMSPVEATAAAASPFHSPRSLGLGNIGGCVMAFLWMTTMACLTSQFYSGWWFQPLWKILVGWDDFSKYMFYWNYLKILEPFWLVVKKTSWKMMEFVNGQDEIPYMENKTCLKPPTSLKVIMFHTNL